jgi:hypothetical protein
VPVPVHPEQLSLFAAFGTQWPLGHSLSDVQ